MQFSLLRGVSRIAAVCCAVAACVCGQQTVNFASISGRVTDQTGAAVARAQVIAQQTETNIAATQFTDSEGRFRFPYLQVGPYMITVQHAGFAEFVQHVVLSVGAAFEIPIVVHVGSERTQITVTEEAPVLEAARSQISSTVSQTELRDLPSNGRNFLDLALIAPGVSPTNTASTQLFAETSAVPGQGLSVNSQRNFSNSFILDGLSANDDAAGLTGTFVPLDVIDQMQVVTSGGQPEFGRALGGYLNILTKSGTNKLHGDVYGFFKNQRFNAANPLTGFKLPLTQAQYGASVGGPIVHDRTFFFSNFEQRELNQDGLITIDSGNAARIDARLLSTGYRGPQIGTGLYPNPVHDTNFLAKLDHEFRSNDQFSARYNLYDVTSNNSRGAGALSAISAAAGLSDLDQTIAASNIWTISPRTVNETRGQYTHSNLQAPVNDPIGPAVSISGVASFGTLSGSPTARVDDLVEIADNLSRQQGPHALRAGVDFLYNDLTITFPQSSRGSYSFASLANFLAGTYNNSGFTQSFGNPVAPQTNPNIGFYAQDEWKVTSALTLNLGARYDLQFLKTMATDKNNVAPRAGFAWTPFASRRTVIRGSFGIFYDRIPLRPLANALLSSGNTTLFTNSTFVTVSLSPTQQGAPVFPNILSALPAGVLVNYTTMNPHIQNAYSDQGSFEIEQQLGQRSTLSASYQHVRGIHLIVSINQNAPTCVASGTNNGCRPNSAYGNNKQYTSGADSQYDGLEVSFVQRPVNWGNYRISYTYSKALDDVGEFFFSAPINNFNIWQDWARSDDDQRHRFVLDAIAHTPLGAAHTRWEHLSHGFELSGILQYYSPLPFNVVTGANTVQGTTARPLVNGSYIGRNTGEGFDFFSMSARLSRTFVLRENLHIQGLIEAFNALNHRNNLFPNGTFGSGAFPTTPLSTFGQPTAVGDPRSLQLALRVSF
jgi:hypothetical protein